MLLGSHFTRFFLFWWHLRSKQKDIVSYHLSHAYWRGIAIHHLASLIIVGVSCVLNSTKISVLCYWGPISPGSFYSGGTFALNKKILCPIIFHMPIGEEYAIHHLASLVIVGVSCVLNSTKISVLCYWGPISPGSFYSGGTFTLNKKILSPIIFHMPIGEE